MAYEDPIEAHLRALTEVPWNKRKDRFETRANKTHSAGIVETLAELGITATAEISAARSGRYMVTVMAEELPKILKAIERTGAKAISHRRKRDSAQQQN